MATGDTCADCAYFVRKLDDDELHRCSLKKVEVYSDYTCSMFKTKKK